ncbi:MAG: hypothetical protein QMD65_02070 [Patescibacteria group bacterium]|nr:hypothetical protein [Patescibacteria group bacterium]
MKYKIFDINKEKEINAFLKENSGNVADKVHFGTAGKIAFFYDDEFSEEKERNKVIIGALKKAVIEHEIKRLSIEPKYRFFTAQNLKGNNAAVQQELSQIVAEKTGLEGSIYYLEQIIEELEEARDK